MRFWALLFLLIYTGLLATGLGVGRAEFVPYLSAKFAPDSDQTLSAGYLPELGLSIQSQYLELSRCKNEVASQVEQLQPSYIRDPVMRYCIDLADGVTAGAPTHAFAHLVGAMAALELGDAAGMRSRLALALKFAPTEQWLALGRVELAEKARQRFGSDGLESESADIALLVHSLSGISAIAGRYISDPNFRERVIEAVEKLSERDQERFLQQVSLAAQRDNQ